MRGIIYPKNYFSSSLPDEVFEAEYEVVKSLGIPVAFYDQESLNFDNKVKIFNLDKEVDSYIYRGWMLAENEYKKIENSLESRGTLLSITTEEYLKSHSFENWYYAFEDFTFPSVIINDPTNKAEIEHAISALSSEKFFVKDFVKSIADPDASIANTPDDLHITIKNYLRERESYLMGKIVVREFIELNQNIAEIRTWWVNGALCLITSHPNFTDKSIPDISEVEFYLETLKPHVSDFGELFVSIDIAKTMTGEWVIVEVGNGQVSGLPGNVTTEELTLLFTALNGR